MGRIGLGRRRRLGRVLGLAGVVGLGLVLSVAAQDGPERSGIALSSTLDPATVPLQRSGLSEPATVRLRLTAPETQGPRWDVALALDRSASVALATVRETAGRIVAHLGRNDRAAVVSFSESARIDQALTGDRASVRQAIAGLRAGRRTALGDGLKQALDELEANGRSDARSLLVVVTDGVNLVGRSPMSQLERIRSGEARLAVVGAATLLRNRLLAEMARRADGTFYRRFGADALEDLFGRMERTLLARDLILTTAFDSALQYQGHEGPDAPSVAPGEGLTQLRWRRARLFRGEVWTPAFRVVGTEVGAFSLHRAPSGLTYEGTDGLDRSIPFGSPKALTVEAP